MSKGKNLVVLLWAALVSFLAIDPLASIRLGVNGIVRLDTVMSRLLSRGHADTSRMV